MINIYYLIFLTKLTYHIQLLNDNLQYIQHLFLNY